MNDAAGFIQQFSGPKMKATRAKPVYEMVDPKVVSGKEIWPDRDDVDGIEVLVCTQVFPDGQRYENTTRTSTLLRVDLETGTYETLNTIYQLIK